MGFIWKQFTRPQFTRPVMVLMLLAAGGCSSSGDPAAAPTTTPQPTPTVEATHQKPEDLIGPGVCQDTVEMILELADSNGGWQQWDEQDWFAWWDRAYELGDWATMAKDRDVQQAGRELRDHPAEEVSQIVYPVFNLAAVCSNSGLVDSRDFDDVVDSFLQTD